MIVTIFQIIDTNRNILSLAIAPTLFWTLVKLRLESALSALLYLILSLFYNFYI